jgi:hypothetical protein
MPCESAATLTRRQKVVLCFFDVEKNSVVNRCLNLKHRVFVANKPKFVSIIIGFVNRLIFSVQCSFG